MGSYLDSSDADLIALTRLRRAQRRATLVEQAPCLRVAATLPTVEFARSCAEVTSSQTRWKSAMQSWRRRQWRAIAPATTAWAG